MPRMMSGWVRLSRLVRAPQVARVIGEALAAETLLGQLVRWIIVPMAPSSTRIRSLTSSGSSAMRSARARFQLDLLVHLAHLTSEFRRGRYAGWRATPCCPSVPDALAAWRTRVAADKEQVERAREVADPADFYAPMTSRFRMDPRRTDDATLNALARSGERR